MRVDFIVRRNYYNNVVRIDGLKDPPKDPAALAALRLNLGEPFRESAVHEAIGRLQDLLRSEGLYLAKITFDLGPHDDTRQMDITVHVDPGARSLVGNITVKNQTHYADAELIKRSKISEKNDLTSGRLTRGSQRIKKYLVNQGYLGAGVVITPGTYDPAANRTPLSIDVTAGPRVRVELTGARISKGRLRKLLPIYAEGAVDEDLLQEGRRNIRDFFQREGYFDADVKVSFARGRTRPRIASSATKSRGATSSVWPPSRSMETVFQQGTALRPAAASNCFVRVERAFQPIADARGYRFDQRPVSLERLSRRTSDIRGGR